MSLLCPACDAAIPPADINVATDVALCRACGRVTRLSTLAGAAPDEPAPPPQPLAIPAGAWDIDDGVERRIGATLRNPIGAFILMFAVVWSGISLTMIGASQFAAGHASAQPNLIVIPFAMVLPVVWAFALLMLVGKVEIRLRGESGTLFTGVGPIGWSRPFNLADFTRVYEDFAGWSQDRQPRRCIVLEGARRLTFGSLLTNARRYFLAQTLQSLITQ